MDTRIPSGYSRFRGSTKTQSKEKLIASPSVDQGKKFPGKERPTGVRRERKVQGRGLVELRQLWQWVAYRRVWNVGKGRYDKLPINPHDGSNAKANDVRTWGMFDEAWRYAVENGLTGNVSGM